MSNYARIRPGKRMCPLLPGIKPPVFYSFYFHVVRNDCFYYIPRIQPCYNQAKLDESAYVTSVRAGSLVFTVGG
jgi:hypothetical protein